MIVPQSTTPQEEFNLMFMKQAAADVRVQLLEFDTNKNVRRIMYDGRELRGAFYVHPDDYVSYIPKPISHAFNLYLFWLVEGSHVRMLCDRINDNISVFVDGTCIYKAAIKNPSKEG